MSASSLITQEVANDAVYDALSLLIGEGRRYSVDDIGLGIGIPARTVSSWIANARENRRAPKARDILRLAHFLKDDGPRFLSKIYGPIGIVAQAEKPQDCDPAYLLAALTGAAAELAIAMQDRNFCHRDRGRMTPWADNLVTALRSFQSGSH